MSAGGSDFFQRQDAARRRTGHLLMLFALGVLGIILSTFLAAELVLSIWAPRGWDPAQNSPQWHGEILLTVAGVTLVVVALGSIFKIVELAGGGKAVASSLGGYHLNTGSSDLSRQRLLHVVEEMAIASGVPVPPVYLLTHEGGINAFAAGYSPSDAVIGITAGSLEYLTRDELQGVIGHEFSHILNGDMRLNIRLIGLLNGILFISVIGYLLFRLAGTGSGQNRNRDSGQGRLILLVFGLLLYAIGLAGLFFGRLIKAAVSRQREFLADASAVQFTRNPLGLAGALKKIGGLAAGSRLATPRAEEASHMFFSLGVPIHFDALATHPPLEERIRALDPTFDGKFPSTRPISDEEGEGEGEGEETPVPASEAAMGLAPRVRPRAAAQEALAQVGSPTPETVDIAASILARLPGPLVSAAREPYSARLIALALLLSDQAEVRARQFERLEASLDAGSLDALRRIAPLVDQVGPASRLPLLQLTIPALRALSPRQYQDFRPLVEDLVAADRKVSLFEYCLRRMLIRHLDGHFQPAKPPRIRIHDLDSARTEVAVLLSAVAYSGGDSQAAMAWEKGWSPLALGAQQLLPREASDLKAVDAALGVLANAAPAVRLAVLTACMNCVTADGTISVREAELIRAIADSLHCPMSPLFADE